MSELPRCPECGSGYTYEDRSQYVCPECGHEWAQHAEVPADNRVVRDANGNRVVAEHFIQSWQRMGASPTSMEFPEVFTALQQGAIDGQENPLALIESAGFYQVQSHLNLTSHVIEPLAVSI
jgi:predicted  nucleic acid-binding Zn-ribbon protein